MSQYIIKLTNGNYMKYDQIDSYQLLVEDVSILYAETFETYKEAEKFAKCINERKDGEYRILSYENAVSVVEIDNDGNWLSESELVVYKTISTSDSYNVEVTKDTYAGCSNWEEVIYLESEDGKDYDGIFEKYVGKKIKLTIEEI